MSSEHSHVPSPSAHAITPAVLLLTIACVLSACASGGNAFQPPKPRDAHYFCLPDSAIKYRGLASEYGKLARPATKTGSCRHQ